MKLLIDLDVNHTWPNKPPWFCDMYKWIISHLFCLSNKIGTTTSTLPRNEPQIPCLAPTTKTEVMSNALKCSDIP